MNDKRLYFSVARQITKLIENGSYPPGSRLPGERELAEQLNVSRVTIREAEIALQALGRLDIRTGSGVYVVDAADRHNGGLPDVSAFELTEARALFEAEAAALAAAHISEEALANLEAYQGQMADPSLSDEETEQADRDFHLAIAAATGNAAVCYVVETLWTMRTDVEGVKEVYESVCSDDATARGDEHADILEALRSRDANEARRTMRRHFTRLIGSMLDVAEEQAIRELRERSTESRRRFLNSAEI